MLKLALPQTPIYDIFVAREEQQRLFGQMLDAEIEPWFMLIKGQGGNGKTQLLQQFIKSCKTHKGPIRDTGIVDFYHLANRNKVGILTTLRDRLGRKGFSSFTKAVNAYERLLAKGDTGSRAALERTEEQAVSTFVRAYQNLAASERTVLLFDTFEVVADTGFGSWFLFEFLPQIKEHSVAIVAGRKLPERLEGLLENKDFISLELPPFTEKDVKAFFAQAGVEIKNKFIKPITQLSAGRPLLIALTADWLREGDSPERLTDYAAGKPDLFERALVARINGLQRPEDFVILSMAHIYHRFDAEVLSHLIPVELRGNRLPQELIQNLARFSFIKYYPDSRTCVLHDEMRRLVTQHIWKEQDYRQEERRQLGREILRYYDEKLAEAENKPAKERNQQEIDALTLESLYHRLYSDLEQNYKFVWDLLEHHLVLYRYDFMADIIQVAEEVNAKRLTPDKVLANITKVSTAWILEETWQINEALALTKEVIADSAGMKYIQARALTIEGLSQTRQVDYTQARQSLDNAFELCSELQNALVKGESLAAEHGLIDAKRLHFDQSMILNSLGFIARSLGLLDESKSYYQRALHISKAQGDEDWEAVALANLAQVDRWLGNLQDALDYIYMSLEIRERLNLQVNMAIGYHYLGLIYRDNGNFLQAREFLQKALYIFEANNRLSRSGVVHRALGWVAYLEHDYTEAETRLKIAHQIFTELMAEREFPDLFHKQGRLYQAQGKLKNAHEALEKSLQLAERFSNMFFVANSLADLGRLALLEEQYDKIIEYAERINKIEQQGYSFRPVYAKMEVLLGDLAEIQGDLDKAFEHYGKAHVHWGRHNQWRLNRGLDDLRQKFIKLPSEQRTRQAKRLTSFWAQQAELTQRYPHVLSMFRRFAGEEELHSF